MRRLGFPSSKNDNACPEQLQRLITRVEEAVWKIMKSIARSLKSILVGQETRRDLMETSEFAIGWPFLSPRFLEQMFAKMLPRLIFMPSSVVGS